jgi:hypothetical protein
MNSVQPSKASLEMAWQLAINEPTIHAYTEPPSRFKDRPPVKFIPILKDKNSLDSAVHHLLTSESVRLGALTTAFGMEAGMLSEMRAYGGEDRTLISLAAWREGKDLVTNRKAFEQFLRAVCDNAILTTDWNIHGCKWTRLYEGPIYYAVQMLPELAPRRIKFGFTTSMRSRMTEYTRTSPESRVLNMWPCYSVREEKFMHKQLESVATRINEELFDVPCYETAKKLIGSHDLQVEIP